MFHVEQFTRGGVKHFYLTGELCRVHKTIIFSRFIFSPFFCPVKYFYLTLKKVSHGSNKPAFSHSSFYSFFMVLSSSLKRSFSIYGSFPSFLLPLSLRVSSPLFLYPPIPSFHPKRKAIFLVNLSSWNKKKITPLLAPPTHPLEISGVCRDSPLAFFLLFFGATQPLRIFFPFFRGGITFMGFTS